MLDVFSDAPAGNGVREERHLFWATRQVDQVIQAGDDLLQVLLGAGGLRHHGNYVSDISSITRLATERLSNFVAAR